MSQQLPRKALRSKEYCFISMHYERQMNGAVREHSSFTEANYPSLGERRHPRTGCHDMKLSSKDFRALKRAAETIDAQQDVMRRLQYRSRDSAQSGAWTEALMLVLVSAFALGVAGLATVAGNSDTNSDSQHIVSADQLFNRTTREN
jgi:hypothetical protein